MKQTEIILIILAAAGLLLWLLWRLGRLRDALRREREENLHLRELLQMGNQMAQTDLEQLRKLRHDLRQYLILTEERSLSPDSASTLRNALEELPAEPRRESWAMSVLEQYYLDQANALGFTSLIKGGQIASAQFECTDPEDESRLFRFNLFGEK